MTDLQSPEVKDLAAALVKAQQQIKPALKSADNPFFKSKYADLTAVVEACAAPLAANGLCYTQAIQGETLVTTLYHTSGQYVRSVANIKPTKPDPQAFGSAVTYMRRYSLAALVGVCTEDDDGNAASEPSKTTGKAQTKAQAQTNTHTEVGAGSFSMAGEPDPANPFTTGEERRAWMVEAKDDLHVVEDEDMLAEWLDKHGGKIKWLGTMQGKAMNELVNEKRAQIGHKQFDQKAAV